MEQSDWKKDAITTGLRILLFSCISAASLNFLTDSATLLTPYASMDYQIFRQVGRCWAEGMIPYRDIFDHKGPILFFIQMLAMSISYGKVGILILESICLGAALEMLWRLGRHLGCSKPVVISALSVFLFSIIAYSGSGNTCEEWSMPWVIYPLLTAVRYATGDSRNLCRRAILCGICFGIVAQIRLNNTAIIAGVCAGMTISMIYRREYLRLAKVTAYFISGSIIAILPGILYFAANDALYEYYYTTLPFCVNYLNKWPANIHDQVAIRQALIHLIPCISASVMAVIYDLKRHSGLSFFIIPAALITALTFSQGTCSSYYYTMVCPLTATAIFLTIPRKAPDIAATIVLCLTSCIPSLSMPFNNFRFNYIYHKLDRMPEYHNTFSRNKDIIGVIPTADLDSVYFLESGSTLDALYSTGRLPVGKYTSQQNYFSEIDTVIARDIINQFEQANPKWIVAGDRPLDAIPYLSRHTDKYDLIKYFPDGYCQYCNLYISANRIYRRIE